MQNYNKSKTSVEQKNTITHRNKLGLIDPTVAGIDIGAQEIYVAVPDGKGETLVIAFGTTTPELNKIAETLKKAQVTTAVMEATGIYWIPLYEILESLNFKPILVDAKSVKNVPGRKTDVQDCQWIQVLYSNGLLRAAFRPSRDRLKLRAYVRRRLNVIKTKQVALLHLEKALQLMNVKLSTAVSDINGVSGMNIIRAIVEGNQDPHYLASLRNSGCKKSPEVFVDALSGNFQEEHIFTLKQALDLYDFANKQLQECDEKILAEFETFPNVVETLPPKTDKDKKRRCIALKKPDNNDYSFDARAILWKKSGIDLVALPGIGASTAMLIYAELGGTDVSAWKSEKEFASWLKLCSGNNISGGKRRKSKKQPCANYITQALKMAALSAKKSKSAIGGHIRRICSRTDKPKGIKAGAHKLARMTYNMCKNGWSYYEKGEDYYEKSQAERYLKNLQKKARQQGYELIPIAS